MYDKQARMKMAKDTISGTDWYGDELSQVTTGWCIIAPIERYSGYRYFQ